MPLGADAAAAGGWTGKSARAGAASAVGQRQQALVEDNGDVAAASADATAERTGAGGAAGDEAAADTAVEVDKLLAEAVDTVERRDASDADTDDDAPQAAAAAQRPPARGNSDRPCDLIILHCTASASTTVLALDVTIALPDSVAGMTGMNARDEVDWDRALSLARRRKEKMRMEVESRGASFEPIVLSSNGKIDDDSEKVLRKLSSEWGLAHGCTAGMALRVLRGRISNEIHKWNGECLLNLCRMKVAFD